MSDTHFHIHLHIPEIAELSRKVDLLTQQGVQIMGALDDLKAQLAAANDQTNQIASTLTEVASDIDDLIAKLAAGTPGSEEVVEATAAATALTARLTETATALRAVADKHTP